MSNLLLPRKSDIIKSDQGSWIELGVEGGGGLLTRNPQRSKLKSKYPEPLTLGGGGGRLTRLRSIAISCLSGAWVGVYGLVKGCVFVDLRGASSLKIPKPLTCRRSERLPNTCSGALEFGRFEPGGLFLSGWKTLIRNFHQLGFPSNHQTRNLV